MHWASILGLILIFIGGLLSLYGSVQSDKETESKLTAKIDERNTKIEELSKLNQELTGVNKELINQNVNLLDKSDNIQDGNLTLLDKNNNLLQRIEQYQKEIELKNKTIEELEKNAKTMSRNLSTIQFDGTYLDKTGGSISLIVGTEESVAFTKYIKLMSEKKWNELIKESEIQIKNSPTWKTSYYYKAIGLYNIGQRSDALKLFEYVEKETPGDAQYILELASIYDQIGNKNKANELRSQIPKEQQVKFKMKK